MPHARNDFLADVAALFEIDAVQEIEIDVVRKDVAIGEIDAALGRDRVDAQRLVSRQMRRAEGGGLRTRQDRPRAEARIARVGIDDGVLRGVLRLAPERDDAEPGALVGDGDLGAQLVEAEPPGEIGRLDGGAIDEETRAAPRGTRTTIMSNRILPWGVRRPA